VPHPTVTVVVPIHNEEGFLLPAIERLTAEMSTVDADIDILLVENGSTDATRSVAADLAASRSDISLLTLPDPDYGAAMRAGFSAASGRWVANFDIDYFSAAFLSRALELADRADVVLASKRAPGSNDRRSAFRRTGTRVFNRLLQWGFGSKVTDTHGMKLVRAEVSAALLPKVLSTQDLFDTELVLRSERAGYRIVELPVVVEEQRQARSSYLRRVPRTLAGLWKIRSAMRRDLDGT